MNRTCPRCNRQFLGHQRGPSNGAQNPRQRTRDHILPQAWGARSVLYGDVRNIVIICAECNNFRQMAFDCWAMAACIDAVRVEFGLTRRQMFKRWKLGPALQEHKASAVRIPDHTVERRVQVERELQRTKAQDAVAIGRIVDRLGPDRFIWPADTEEAQRHNFEVLIGAGYKPPTHEDTP